MPTFLLTSRHSPEACAQFVEKSRKIALALAENIEALAKKHGVKVVGLWSAMPEHIVVSIYEAPSLEAFQKLSMEPEFLAWSSCTTTKTRIVSGLEDIVKKLKQAK